MSADTAPGTAAPAGAQTVVDGVAVGAACAATLDHMVAGIPGGWTLHAPGVVAGVTGIAAPTLNGVTVYGEDVSREPVAGLLELVAGAGVPHCLQLSPRCGAELRELALAHGMRCEADVPLMILASGGAPPEVEQGELVIEVLEPDHAAVHADVAAAGFQMPSEEFLRLVTPAVLRLSGVRAYVGALGGVPVTTGVGIRVNESVGVFSVATLPAYRRHGYGAAITACAVRDGLEQGARWAWLQSSPDGCGVYQKLGFRILESWELWITT